MKQLITPVLISLSMVFGQTPFTYPGKPDPHGKDDCTYCHQVAEGDTKSPSLKNLKLNSCNDCHPPRAVHERIHIMWDMNLDGEHINIPGKLKLPDGKMHCITCHVEMMEESRANRNRLYGGPYPREDDFCFICHEDDRYEKVNPHRKNIWNNNGTSCLYCHVTKPSPENHTLINQKMHLSMDATCNKCHFMHAHEQDHQGKDITAARSRRGYEAIDERLHRTEQKLKILFPLEEGKIIQCNTCHYTHERGVNPKEYVIYESIFRENKYYLRIPKKRLCYACHDR